MVDVITLGCRLNQYDSARLKSLLSDYDGNLIILNTCAVTAKAYSEAKKVLRRLRRENKTATIAVIGCSLKYSNNCDQDFKEADFIAFNEKSLLEKLNVTPKQEIIPDFGERTRAFLKIQEGCDRKCSYCVVPYVRGKSVSRKICEIEKEFDSLLRKNYKEIVLTGTNISDYGKDIENKLSLKDVLKLLMKKEGDFRIRLSSVEFSVIDDDFIQLIRDNEEKICPHIHIPIQSCSPVVLKSMNRDQDVKRLKQTIDKIFASIPFVGIGCDILCAFPTEGEKEFKETVDFLEDSPISFFHIFTFSKREHTAAKFLKPLPEKVAKERKHILLDLAAKKKSLFIKKNEGRVLKALTLENKTALSSNFIEFKISSNSKPNEFRNYFLRLDSFGNPFGEEV